MKIAIPAAIGLGVLLAIPMMLQWERPPMDSTQQGFRGTGMVQVDNPRMMAVKKAAATVPEASDQAETGGQKASEIYENVKVLGDLNEAQFTRLMLAITEWVSPEEGCNYCHNEENLADDSVYTKVVARKMLQMTANINSQWKPHVAETGVTCYTCHRGQPVPANVWSINPGPKQAGGMAGSRNGQNLAASQVGFSSLPYDPFRDLLTKTESIRVAATNGVAGRPQVPDPAGREDLWPDDALLPVDGCELHLLPQLTQLLGLDPEPPTRVKAWHGIEMVSNINENYIQSLASVFPDNRKGPTGDVLKANCATCHQGANKPLYGAQMLKDYIVELSAAKE
jgi:photosynthetic reaction center cytochrome c subunit